VILKVHSVTRPNVIVPNSHARSNTKGLFVMMTDNQASLLAHSIRFATDAHGDQKRKYTHEPYITHPLAVMKIVQSVPHTPEMLMAAVLHDVVEDTPVDILTIRDEFGPVVAQYVNGLTDVSRPEDGNRVARKALDRQHISSQVAEVHTIKLADMIHNTQSIREHDPNFWRVYREEKRLLLEVLVLGDRTLHFHARTQIEQ
jgi:(p)ppGpp synthase/HD superfamily hydrolase